MALILPCLYSEVEGPALAAIVDEICEIPYLHEVIIGLDRADEEQFARAREFFSRLPQRHRVLWNDGPRLRSVDAALAERQLAPSEPGKGRNVWYCMGYFLASDAGEAVALHDCDILTYERGIVSRLLYPVMHPTFDYSFAKGFYFRAADGRMNGRVARLLVTPLLRALGQTIGPHPYIEYIDSFRYPLAGEFAMRRGVVGSIRIPSDWGLEIGTLSEVFRQCERRAVCQVEVADRYDHKHQDLSAEDASAGLNRMATDIAKALYRKLAIDGVVLSPHIFRTLKASYFRIALDMVDQYNADAIINGYDFDRHEEEATVEVFAQAIMRAGEQFLSNPMEAPFIANWSRVVNAVPDIYERIVAAVEADNAA